MSLLIFAEVKELVSLLLCNQNYFGFKTNKMAETEPGSSSSVPTEPEEIIEKSDEYSEPEKKRRKLLKGQETKPDKLELRLGGILCCAVCLDLPRVAIYQVCIISCLLSILSSLKLNDRLCVLFCILFESYT